MQGKKTLDRHEDLMNRMATSLGADLDEAELRGDLTPEGRTDMLMACTGCTDPAACKEWLLGNGSADEAPGYCRNRGSLRELAQR
ncbi:hypothetical protein roselon_01908 [Roseibacterium elongatum DSM 19469]|uniref:DUF6455 domain-containing protein n=1 Tax=Roseicyclus elongatus DSM 19469 TaxID=1294273 RepID=W8S242_9RHOB|nr:DUF6455 family protein [Roseibacterium elongatum]AHM04267.1 hypothetical protein roselon_01908 [Roseibacterium elongatum DSM 19469]